MPPQQAAPATQQEAANADAAKPYVVIAAAALIKMDFMKSLRLIKRTFDRLKPTDAPWVASRGAAQKETLGTE